MESPLACGGVRYWVRRESVSKRAPSTRAGHRTKTTRTALTTRRRTIPSCSIDFWSIVQSATAVPMALAHSSLIEEGDGQRNRRLLAFSFRILNRPSEKRAVCAQECAQTAVRKQVVGRRHKALVSLHLTQKARVWTRVAFYRLAIERFRVSVIVTYTCRRAVRWPRG